MTPAHLRTIAASAPLRGLSYEACVCTKLTERVLSSTARGPRGEPLGLPASVRRSLHIAGVHDGPWAPIDAMQAHLALTYAHVHAAGPHLPGPEQMTPGRVYLCQGWDGLDDGRIVAASRGHAWLWLADTVDTGWCLESSYGPRRDDYRGPRLWCGEGRISLAGAIDVDGLPTRAWSPMAWHWRGGTWDQTAWVEVS